MKVVKFLTFESESTGLPFKDTAVLWKVEPKKKTCLVVSNLTKAPG